MLFLHMKNTCHDTILMDNKSGIDIHYSYIDADGSKKFLKTWWDWAGPIPQKDDVVVLHWGDNSEETDPWIVAGRIISGTNEKTLNIILKK